MNNEKKKKKPGPVKKYTKMLNVAITPEVYDAIKRIAELEETTVSVTVRDLLETMMPNIKMAIELMEQAKSLSDKGKKALAAELERHEQHLVQSMEYGVGNAVKSVEEAVEDEKEEEKDPRGKLPM